MQVGMGLTRYRGDVVTAFQYALAIFTLTALIGLANALQIFGTLDRNTLLTHLHSGTLGWITLGVIGLTIWIFGSGSAGQGDLRTPVRLTALVTAVYVLAFWSGNFYARAATGVLELVAIVGWWAWAGRRAMSTGFGSLPLPQLALILALTTLVIGSVLGVLAQILFATGAVTPALGRSVIGGHAAAQVAGYLVLFAVAVIEWRVSRSGGARSMWGLIQVYLLFLAGLFIAIGELFGVLPLTMLSTLFQIAAIVIIVVRLGPAAAAGGWGAPTAQRHFAAAVPFLALAVVLVFYLVQLLTQAQGDFSKVPPGIIHALDHAMFIGVSTNVLFGAIRSIDGAQGSLVDHLIFWGLNLGALAFIGTLVFVGAYTEPVRYTAPVMGLAVLLGIGTYLMRLRADAAPRR